MPKYDQETQARIKTQEALKNAATLFKALDQRYDDFLSKQTMPKRSRLAQFKEQSASIDIFTDGRLIHKSTEKEGKRTSKHAISQWLYLERDDRHPFEYFEEQFFPVSEILLSTRKPTTPEYCPHAIFIKRHQLERVAERLSKTRLEKILRPISPYIIGLINYQDKCNKEIENGKFIMLTNEAYVVVKVFNKMSKYKCDSGYALTTILPQTMWSKRRAKLLNKWVRLLSKGKRIGESKGIEPILVLKPSLINLKERREIELNEMTMIYG